MEELISVIVPVYNVEKFLNKCINSIINQTYKKLEIIIIDDGSTDKSGKICDEWKEKDTRIKVIHQKNYGLSVARNKGIEICTGNYISFVDSDDYLELDMLENLYKNIRENNVKLSACGIFDENFYKQEQRGCKENYIADAEEMIERMFTKNDIHIGVWGKLYKKELFDEIRFPVGKINEDLATTYLLFDKSGRVSHINIPGYHYIQRGGSISSSNFKKENLSNVEYKEEILNFVEEKYPKLNEKAEIFLIDALIKFITICRKNNFKTEYINLKNKLKKYKKRILKNSKMKLRLKAKSLRIILLGI